jgi:hypothetical protein
MKTLKVEEVCLAGYETFEHVASRLPVHLEGLQRPGACTPRSGIVHRQSSKPNEPSKRLRAGRLRVQPKGFTPMPDGE